MRANRSATAGRKTAGVTLGGTAGRTLLALTTLLPVCAAIVGYLLVDSLPRRSGAAPIAGLAAPVRIELDRRAVPRVIGTSLGDVYRAQGFIHAQERYFQMDLTRRSAAGELAALFGRRALEADRARRVFQFRARARALLESLAASEREYLEAYSEGVNAGLDDLGTRPPEYLALGQAPAPWSAEDSLLVVYAIYTMLSNNEDFERGQGVMRATLPRPVHEFLTPSSTRFDRPIVASATSDPTGGYRGGAIPSPDVVDVRDAGAASGNVVRQPFAAGSNQWALPGARTRSGHALLANDPHLGLRVPNTFFRAELYWDDALARGVSIPGIPGILIGASDRVAWGATVSYADQSDLVVIETHTDDPALYATPDGFEAFTHAKELVTVAGEPRPVALDVVGTRWGPLVGTDWRGRPLALRATWLDPDGVDLSLLNVPLASSADEAIGQLARWSGPSLNWLVADASGRVAWAVNGPIPARRNFDGSVPESWADGTRGWHGRETLPRIEASSERALFTANNRSLEYEESLALGRIWMPPFRAHRIEGLLLDGAGSSEADSLAMQLDTRTTAYDFLRTLVLEAVASADPNAALREARARIVEWNGRADPDQLAFDLLHRYYDALLEAVLAPMLAPVRAADPSFVYRWPLADEPLRRILEARPAHLLPGQYADWTALLRDVLEDVVADDGARAATPWGDVNRLRIAHPLAAIPLVGSWLAYEPFALPGSPLSLRVATPQYGAVFRMSIAPAAPQDGILELAGGQSGHFLSRHFDDLLDDWARGAATPFLAGPTVDQFVLLPMP